MIPDMYTLPSPFHPSQKLVIAYSNLLMDQICWGFQALPRIEGVESPELFLTIVTIPLKFMTSHI